MAAVPKRFRRPIKIAAVHCSQVTRKSPKKRRTSDRQTDCVAKELLRPLVPSVNDHLPLRRLRGSMAVIALNVRSKTVLDLLLQLADEVVHLRLVTGVKQMTEFMKQ